MRIRHIIYILSLLILAMTDAAVAQHTPKIKKSEFMSMGSSKEAWKNVKLGNKYYSKALPGGYHLAAVYYGAAIEYNDSYAPLLYRAGVSELWGYSDILAEKHLADAFDLSTSVATDCQFWLGVSRQHLNKFAEAKEDFEDCQTAFNKKDHKRYDAEVQLHLKQCDLGITLSKDKDMAVIQAVSGDVNSEYPEMCPVFSNLDSMLFFGSCNFNNNKTNHKRNKEYFPTSDIYCSQAHYGKFGETTNASSVNKKCIDYPVNMNLTGTGMYVCRKAKKIYHYYRNAGDTRFYKGKKLFKHVLSVTFSSDSTYVLYCSKKGGDVIGGYDIFLAKMVHGKYTPVESIGNKVNTIYDEVYPSFGQNDTVIYYASDGECSVGGFDIIRIPFHNDKLGKPENMGLGLNSGTDENFFQLSPGDQRIGYYASKRSGGKGEYDIYKALLLNEPQVQYQPQPHYFLAVDLAKETALPLEDPEVIKTMRLTVVKGKVTDYDGTKNLYAKVTITDNATNVVTQQIMTDSETGEFTVMLESGKNYAMTVTADGYLFHSENFDIPATSKYQEVHKDIKLLPMDPGSKVVLNNVFFDTGKADLRPESYGELQRLSEVFKLYPSIVIEVSGHTDNQGSRQYNIQLSQNRANSVREYLLSLGVGPGQVVAKGYGPDQPRDTNATAEGRQNNRRVEAKILKN